MKKILPLLFVTLGALAAPDDLPLALRHLYPAAIPAHDYVLEDRGAGPQIARWDAAKLGAPPSAEQIQAAAAQARTQRAAEQTAQTRERTALAAALQKLKDGALLSDGDVRAILAALVREKLGEPARTSEPKNPTLLPR